MKKIIITLLSILTMSAACVCACNKNDKNTDVRLRDVQKIEQTDGENNGCPECPEDGHCDKNRKHGRRFP